jgi:hypothetical protein
MTHESISTDIANEFESTYLVHTYIPLVRKYKFRAKRMLQVHPGRFISRYNFASLEQRNAIYVDFGGSINILRVL